MRNENYMEYMDGKRRFLTFFLQKEQYGIDILNVSEIIATIKITPLPRTPRFVKGVINLRGSIIPVVDLRQKFGMNSKKNDLDTAIIISVIFDVKVGFIVDQVEDVLTFDKNDLVEVPQFANRINTDFIEGMVKTENDVIMVLEMEKMLDEDLFSLLAHNDMAAAS
ncbi:chemotaxis protein CheW [Sulfuricurvum sp.]|uniref:chemotaxis protein CheW n=1 Tax=Sulfuricurvum sp. TaxID=2025608 RepID=UPI002E2FEBFF|nr:chemotaxis protein CheW [Sulfuricurvum sp.]HEX5330942.1 chemotaxis protein CheW [Sulfuricurvum sp.]